MEPVKRKRGRPPGYTLTPEEKAKRQAKREANRTAYLKKTGAKMTPAEATTKLARMTSKVDVVSALMELDLDVRWVLGQLKRIGESGGSNLEMSAVRQVMQFLSQGGLMTEANITPKGRLKKETPPESIIGDKDLTPARIDEIVQQNMTIEGDDDASHRVHLAETGS